MSDERSTLSGFFSDFMDLISDYGCKFYNKEEFCNDILKLHSAYKIYPSPEIMYKAMIQRLTYCSHITRKEDGIGRVLANFKSTEAKTQIEWIDEELDTLKCPPKIIF